MKGLRGAWLGLGALGYFAASLAWLHLSRPLNRSEFAAGSIDNTSPDGLSLAYRYLRSRGGAGVLSQPLGAADLAPGAVVFRVRPDPPPPRHGDPEEACEDEGTKAEKGGQQTRPG